jgi:hypothetical protein
MNRRPLLIALHPASWIVCALAVCDVQPVTDLKLKKSVTNQPSYISLIIFWFTRDSWLVTTPDNPLPDQRKQRQ